MTATRLATLVKGALKDYDELWQVQDDCDSVLLLTIGKEEFYLSIEKVKADE